MSKRRATQKAKQPAPPPPAALADQPWARALLALWIAAIVGAYLYVQLGRLFLR